MVTGKESNSRVEDYIGMFRILHTAREKRSNEKDRADYIFIKQEQYEEDVTKVWRIFYYFFRNNSRII